MSTENSQDANISFQHLMMDQANFQDGFESPSLWQADSHSYQTGSEGFNPTI